MKQKCLFWIITGLTSLLLLNCGATPPGSGSSGGSIGSGGGTGGTGGGGGGGGPSWTFNNTVYPADMEWINNQYVMVGAAGMIKSSADGVNWTDHTSAQITADLYNVASNGTIYIVTGAAGVIYSSPDLITWTQRIPTGDIATAYDELLWNGTQFTAFVEYYSIPSPFSIKSYVSTSTNGINWTTTSLGSLVLYMIGNIIWDGTKYIHMKNWMTATIPYKPLTSTDGVIWTLSPNAIDDTSTAADDGSYIVGIEFFKGKYYVALENLSSTSHILSSSDLVTWTIVQTFTGGWYLDIKATADRICASGNFLTDDAQCSLDGITWTTYAFSSYYTMQRTIGTLNSIVSWGTNFGAGPASVFGTLQNP